MTHETVSNTGAQTPLVTQQSAQRGTAEAALMGETPPTPGQMLGFVHWLSCSFPYKANAKRDKTNAKRMDIDTAADEAKAWTEFLGGNWIRAVRGQNRYSQGLRCGGVSLWYGGQFSMGIGLEVTGDGCRELEMTLAGQGWPAFLSKLVKLGARFSRLDVAIDDREGLLSLNKISRCCDNGTKVTRLRHTSRLSHSDSRSGHEITTGYVYGSPESDTMLRIYNKALEQSNHNHHIRVELQTRRKKSAELAKRLATGDSGIIAGVIAATIDFKVKGVGSHRYRWKSQKWWEDFLEQAEKVRLSIAPSHQSLQKSMVALENQYGMTMARVVREYGEPRLLEMARNGEARLIVKEAKTWANYKYKQAC